MHVSPWALNGMKRILTPGETWAKHNGAKNPFDPLILLHAAVLAQ